MLLLTCFSICPNLRIGIRSEDLEDFVKRTIRGSGMALSSPRLVIPAAIYALWILSHKYFQNDLFDFQVAIYKIYCFFVCFLTCLNLFCLSLSIQFQIVPAMVGLFVYKAAALVQVYRDNQDLQFIFPDDLWPSELDDLWFCLVHYFFSLTSVSL